jgi:hypothetical protein
VIINNQLEKKVMRIKVAILEVNTYNVRAVMPDLDTLGEAIRRVAEETGGVYLYRAYYTINGVKRTDFLVIMSAPASGHRGQHQCFSKSAQEILMQTAVRDLQHQTPLAATPEEVVVFELIDDDHLAAPSNRGGGFNDGRMEHFARSTEAEVL